MADIFVSSSMSTRPITGPDARAAAEVAALVRANADDACDPFPPANEMEILSDAGARGKEAAVHPWISIESGKIAGYGAVDLSKELRRAQLVGPIVHPDFRRRGHGTELLKQMVAQARGYGQKSVRGAVGAQNAAGNALLRKAGFSERARHACLRLGRPERFADIPVEGIRVKRGNYDHAGEAHDFIRRFVPRTEKQTRSLLKSNDYLVVLAQRGKGAIVGMAEVDLRWGDIATVENLEAEPELLASGLGMALLCEAIRAAFERKKTTFLDLVVEAPTPEQLKSYEEAGFTKRYDVVEYVLSL